MRLLHSTGVPFAVAHSPAHPAPSLCCIEWVCANHGTGAARPHTCLVSLF